LSQQYWTAWVYAASDVFNRAWKEFTQNLNDDADWSYDHQNDAEWLITRTRQLDTYANEGHAGDIGHQRYSALEKAIERINSELEEEGKRLVEAQRVREEEERINRESARLNISDAVLDAGKALVQNQFEQAERLLEAHSVIYNQYTKELNFSEYDNMLN